ncbi:MAG: ABC transporter substrate-binding protein [Chloroflexi bacterium]|nr:ABC transporter substrate-binding protein [Chloroflexota bacterium]
MRHHKTTILLLVAGLLSLGLIAVACGSDEDVTPAAPAPSAPAAPAPAAPAPAGQPGEGQSITLLITNLGNGRFDSWLADGEDLKFQRMFNAALVGGKGGSVIVPSLTKSWEMRPDGMAWTFTVQDDFVKFHNGDALGVQDIFFSIDKMLGKEVDALEASGWYEPRNSAESKLFESVELGPGSDQVTVTATVPRPDLPFWMSENAQAPQMMVMPEAYTRSKVKAGDKGFEGYEKEPIGAGPLFVTDFVLEQRYNFERFDDYFWHPGNGFDEDRRVKFEFLRMEVVSEDSTRVAALRAGDADLIEANVLMLDDIQAGGGGVAWQDESAYNWVVMVDCWETDMWCFDKRVRQAVELAFDKRGTVDSLYGRGANVEGWGHVTPNAMGYSSDLDPLPFDPDRARALLKEAGFEGGKFPDGTQVKFDIWTWEAGDTPLLPELSQLMKDAWEKELGFDVTVNVGDASAVRQEWNNRQLPASVLVRTNEARFDGTSIVTGSWTNPDIAWRAIKGPDFEPFKSTSVVAARKALADINPATRPQSFNEAYKVLKDENLWWSAFYTNLPWGVGTRIQPGSYEPWVLVPYVTALWTVELK